MSEKPLEENEYLEIELAYQKLCEFEKNFCENIYEKQTGSIVYEINMARLAELENVNESDLRNLDFTTVEYPSYQNLFEAKYRNKFLKNFAAIKLNELHKKLGPGTLENAAKTDNEIKVRYAATKELDLDNDGVSDRIDIDDTKNSVQTVSDLDIVKNSTNKNTNMDKEKKREKTQEAIDR